MDLYFDCGSGISGDMTLGALVDLGVPLAWLQEQLAALPLTGFSLTEKTVSRHGLTARKIDVLIENKTTSRDYTAIRQLLADSSYPETVKQRALKAFSGLAAAEAKIHNCPVEKVHFHEVGGIDAIADIAGTALALDYLGAEHIAASPLALGTGQVPCRHGILPVPAPATLELLQGVPVYGTGIAQELITPTGAALITTLAEWFGPLPAMTPGKTGYGAGSREIESLPNVLRLISGTFTAPAENPADTAETDRVTIVEACIDDMNPEIFGYLMERLLADGALDVYWIPVFMKKNRPGTMLQVLCRPQDRQRIIHHILSETTSIGVRHYNAARSRLQRRSVVIETDLGPIRAKAVITPAGTSRLTPEYESCRDLAQKTGLPLEEIYRRASAAAQNPEAVLPETPPSPPSSEEI